MGFSLRSIFSQSYISFASYPILKHAYSLTCHQDEAKLINFSGYDFLVCARCTGIYAGALLSAFIFLFIKEYKISLKIIAVFFLIMLADVLLSSLYIYSYSKIFASLTGFLSGFFLFAYILNIIEEDFIIKQEAF